MARDATLNKSALDVFDDNASDTSHALEEILQLMEYDDHVEGNNHKDDEDGDDDDDEPVGAPSTGQFTVCVANLDFSCIVPMKTGELERLFPSLQMATLVNHPVFITDLQDVICAIEFGYKLFSYNSHKPETRNKIVRRLYDLGVTVNIHRSPIY